MDIFQIQIGIIQIDFSYLQGIKTIIQRECQVFGIESDSLQPECPVPNIDMQSFKKQVCRITIPYSIGDCQFSQ